MDGMTASQSTERLRPPRRAIRAGAVGALLLSFLAACGPKTGPEETPAPSSAPPLRIEGQRVLVLPVQRVEVPGADREGVEAELLFAVRERAPRLIWIEPGDLRRAVRRSPGFAEDPNLLPSDAFEHHRERRVVEPLAGHLRRYAALTDARLVLLPRAATTATDSAAAGRVEMSAVIVDARSGNLVWWGAATGEESGAGAVASASAALARAMLSGAETEP